MATAVVRNRLADLDGPSDSQNGKGAKSKRSKKKLVAPKLYYMSIYPGPSVPVPNEFAELVIALEGLFKKKLWLLIQDGDPVEDYHSIDLATFKGFQAETEKIKEQEACVLLLETPGGSADHAYRIAKLFQRRTRNFFTFIPQYAKSAGTLLALAGKEIFMGRDAEIGPLDVQLPDRDREEYGSALDAVQSLERLGTFSISATYNMLHFLMHATQKRTEVLLPHVLNYVTSFVRPLTEKIDTVDFTKKSRELKVAEEYATRLMKGSYSAEEIKGVVTKLVTGYPAHRFVIDYDEAYGLTRKEDKGTFGLKVRPASADIEQKICPLVKFLDDTVFIGRLMEL